MIAIVLMTIVLNFSVEIMPFTDTFIGNHTFNISNLALFTKRPQLRVTFHEKVEGKTEASEKQKNNHIHHIVYQFPELQETMVKALKRVRRKYVHETDSDLDIEPYYPKSITVVGLKSTTVYDVKELAKPGSQTKDYYGFVPFSFNAGPSEFADSAGKYSKNMGFASKSYTDTIPNSILLRSYGHSSVFVTPTPTTTTNPTVRRTTMKLFGPYMPWPDDTEIISSDASQIVPYYNVTQKHIYSWIIKNP